MPLGFLEGVDQAWTKFPHFRILGNLVRRQCFGKGRLGGNSQPQVSLRNIVWELNFSLEKASLPLLGQWINFTWEFELVILLKAQFHLVFCRWTCHVIYVLFHVWFKHKATLPM